MNGRVKKNTWQFPTDPNGNPISFPNAEIYSIRMEDGFRSNVPRAVRQVTANKGAGGIDVMQTDDFRDYRDTNWHTLRANILVGSFHPEA